MSTRRRALALAAVLSLPLAACGGPLDTSCTEESIRVDFPATAGIGVGEFIRPMEMAGTLGEDNVDAPVFRRLWRIASDAGDESGAFVFTLTPRTGSAVVAEFLSLALRVPLRQGAVATVDAAFEGGGWGLVTLAPGEDAAASMRVNGAYARSFTGTVTVLDASPLRLRVDLGATTATGEILRVRGDAAFALAADEVPCS